MAGQSQSKGSVGARLTTTPAKSQTNPSNFNTALYNPGQLLSGQQLANAAQQIANAQTQPLISQYQGQISQNNRNTTGEQNTDFQYYMQLAKDAKGFVDQQTTANQGLQSTLQGIGGNTQNQLSQLGAQYQGGALGRMGALGLSGDSLAQLQAQNDFAKNIATQNAGIDQAYAAKVGANSATNARSLGATTGLAGVEQIGALGRANAIANNAIQDRISSTRAQNPTLAATALGQLRTQERNFAIAQQGVNLKSDALTNTVKQQGIANKQRAQGIGIQQQNANTAAQRAADAAALAKYNSNPNYIGTPAWQRVQSLQGRQWSSNPNAVGSPAWGRVQAANARNAKNKGAGGNKPLSTNENNQWFRQLGQVEALVNSMQAPLTQAAATKLNLPVGTKLSKAQINNMLTGGNNPTGKSFDQVMVQAAYELLGWGHITPQTAAAMNHQGLRGGSFRNGPIKIGPPPGYQHNAGNQANSSAPSAGSLAAAGV